MFDIAKLKDFSPQDLESNGIVSRETFLCLEKYVNLLVQWQNKINLVSNSTIEDVWRRHIFDSLQIFFLHPEKNRWVDLGSGAGLPGLIIASCLMKREGAQVDLIESNSKKCSFLHFVANEFSLPVKIHNARIEEIIPKLSDIQIVTSRALAPLDELIDFSISLLEKGAIGVFPKGKEYKKELTKAANKWHFSYCEHVSITDSRSRILEVIFD